MSKRLSGVLVGFGYWGRNVARNIHQSREFSLTYLIESDPAKCADASILYPEIICFNNLEDYLIYGKLADTGFIATAAHSHFEIAQILLNNNHHLWIEKPITLNSEDANTLRDLSIKVSKKIIVDHTYLYSPAIRRIKHEIDDLKGVISISSTRHGFGKIQPDTDVIWDLAVHDLAILDLFINRDAKKVWAFPLTKDGNNATSALIVVDYDGIHATINCSWMSPMKIRDIQILCKDGSIFFDEIDVSEKIKILNHGVEIIKSDNGEKLVNYRLGDTLIPEIPNEEALALAMQEFGYCINNQIQPLSNIDLAIRLISILEAATISAQNNGAVQEVGI
jgi:predicted dehydrogenase